MNETATLASASNKIRKSGGRDISIDYLRTTLTLMVLAHHSCLAYTGFASFDRQNPFRSTAPVVDITRWRFFDYAENFNDVFFMSLMFFVSGLFVYPAIRRHGVLKFVRDRILRLGVPFAGAVIFLMPIAYYASWQLGVQNLGFLDFYRRLAAHGFAAGPPWFIWVLLFFDIAIAVLLLLFKRLIDSAARGIEKLQYRPLATMAVVFLLSALVYIPLLFHYGFGTWKDFFTPPLSFQVCRFGLYGFWFLFGFLVGVPSPDRGLLSREGPLARNWPVWALGCIAAYNALWFVPRLRLVHQLPGATQHRLETALWVASCVASCFGFLALFRGLKLKSRAWMNSLSRSAYVMYLVHYVFITWTQRLVLNQPVHAALKFSFVFCSTVLLSWLTAQALIRIPKVRSII